MFVALKLHLGNKWGSFLKILDLYNSRIIGRTELGNLSRDLVGGNTKVYNEFRTKVIARLPIRRKLLEVDDEQDMKVVGENDEETSQNVSYREVTEEERTKSGDECSGRTALCDEVLNDDWVASVPSHDASVPIRATIDSKKLGRVNELEDTIHELDVIAEQHQNFSTKLSELQARVANKPENMEAPSTIDPSEITAIHKQSLRALYGEKTQTILDHILQHPQAAIPVVLARLALKQEEWKQMKVKEEEKFKKAMEDRYLKSLDYEIEEWKDEDAKFLDADSLKIDATEKYDARREKQQGMASLLTSLTCQEMLQKTMMPVPRTTYGKRKDETSTPI